MRLSHVEGCIAQQLLLIDIITNAYDRLIQLELSNITTAIIRTRIDALNEIWNRFLNQHQSIMIAVASLDADDHKLIHSYPYFHNNLFAETHERYLQSIGRMTSLSEQETPKPPCTVAPTAVMNPSTDLTSHVSQSRLPRMDLPTFDGSPAEWLSFRDMFEAIVFSRPSITQVEKLQYLKSHLSGSAALLIKNTALTAENFQSSWDALISFYENKRALVNSALYSLTTLKHMTKESATELEKLYSNVMQIFRTLETLQRPVASWDDLFVFITVQRLDSETVKAWEHHLGPSKDPPSWKQLTEFLFSRILSLQAYERSKSGKTGKESNPRAIKSHYQGKAVDKPGISQSTDQESCTICKLKHRITRCPTYNAKTVQQRRELIVKHRLCFNCLKPHRSAVCKSTNRCLKCGWKHHTSIHENFAQAKATKMKSTSIKPDPTSNTDTTTATTSTQVLHVSSKQEIQTSSVLLATARVLLISPTGESSQARVLLDQGAELSLISECLVQHLRLPRTRITIPLVGIGGHKSNTTNGSTSFTIRALHGLTFECVISAHILPKLTASLPSMRCEQRSWPHLDGLSLADPDFLTPSKIDLILGADIYSQILERGLVKGPSGSPVAQFTKLGWIVSGPTSLTTSLSRIQGYHVSCDDQLYSLIHRFWELDEIPQAAAPILSIDEQECEDLFLRTHTRDHRGRYVVRLPFKRSPDQFGDSKGKALRLVNKLVQTLSTNTEYSRAYCDFINEYEQLQHMIRIPDDINETSDSYYLPHHGVWKRNSTTTKLRVVFNGSSRTTSGTSLNSVLYVGAKLQIDLLDVLLWFRLFFYVFSADVEKMYRQILLHPDDQRYQKILWIDQHQRLVTYQLATVTYGLACAPFLALRTFLQLIRDEGAKYPCAVSAMTKGRYVDDIFGGADTVEEAQVAATQLRQLCMAGGFELRKWISNHPTVLQGIPPEHRLNTTAIQLEDSTFVHTLGLSWQPASDTFHFTFESSPSEVITKRSVMSAIAHLFDPLGLVSPVLITGKLIIQELWILKQDWDDPLPSHIANRWTEFISSLQELPQLTFPRWIGYHSDVSIELHGFCDSSQRAYAAVIYVRSVSSSGDVSINMVCSKTKVHL